jgi:hypothetical protein
LSNVPSDNYVYEAPSQIGTSEYTLRAAAVPAGAGPPGPRVGGSGGGSHKNVRQRK